MIFEFKVVLDGISPPIWRLIQVPEWFTFWDLHMAIQDSMGWKNCHKHQFIIKHPFSSYAEYLGIPIDLGICEDETKPAWRFKIADFFSFDNPVIDYEYDFGNCWSHSVILFRIIDDNQHEKEEDVFEEGEEERGLLVDAVKLPRCVDGARACPPEDCSIIGGYEHLLAVLKNPTHRDYKIVKNWLSKEGYDNYNPEHFDPSEVKFSDPNEQLKTIYY